MDATAQASVMDQVFTGSTALAGLILVFLGGIYTAYDGYDATSQRAVKDRFVFRVWLTFVGFFLALVSAGLALSFNWGHSELAFWGSIVALAVSCLILLFIGVRSNLDIG